MPPFASNEEELNCDGSVGMFVEYPLVIAKKHRDKGIPSAEDSLADSESDIGYLTASKSTSSLIGNFLEFNPCSAVAQSFAPCSYNSISRADSNAFRIRTCCGCGCDFDEVESYTREIAILETTRITILNNIDTFDVSEIGEKVDIDIVIDDEAQFYCYECALINQGRTDHTRAIKLVMDEIVTHFDRLHEYEGAQAAKEEESKRFKESISNSVNRERNGKIEVLAFRAMKRAMKNTVSLSQKSRFSRHALDHETSSTESEETEEMEEQSGEIHDIQTVYSSPSSLHYRFDDHTNAGATPDSTKKSKKKRSTMLQRAKKAYSKSMRWICNLDDCHCEKEFTKVRTVAVVWKVV